MTKINTTWIEASVVENEVHMSIVELSHASRTPQELIMSWVSEGVLSPVGSSPEDWRFSGDSLRRAKTAAHLKLDFRNLMFLLRLTCLWHFHIQGSLKSFLPRQS